MLLPPPLLVCQAVYTSIKNIIYFKHFDCILLWGKIVTLSSSSVFVIGEEGCTTVESVTIRNDSAPAESETGKGVGSPSELEPSSLPWESVRSLGWDIELVEATPGIVSVNVSDSWAS